MRGRGRGPCPRLPAARAPHAQARTSIPRAPPCRALGPGPARPVRHKSLAPGRPARPEAGPVWGPLRLAACRPFPARQRRRARGLACRLEKKPAARGGRRPGPARSLAEGLAALRAPLRDTALRPASGPGRRAVPGGARKDRPGLLPSHGARAERRPGSRPARARAQGRATGRAEAAKPGCAGGWGARAAPEQDE
jgi:hypothetical protein